MHLTPFQQFKRERDALILRLYQSMEQKHIAEIFKLTPEWICKIIRKERSLRGSAWHSN